MMYADMYKLINAYAELKISKKRLFGYLTFKDYSNSKIRTQIKAAQEYRSLKVAQRNLEVVYVSGSSGSGKTTFARYLAQKLNFDEFVSGSGDDILDGYDKEECLILDDFRAGSMRFMEVLKMLDNNTNSSVKSRYNNKDLSNCKLIVVTSIKTPCDLYSKLQEDGSDEPSEQFYRRLKHHYFTIDKEGNIIEYSLNSDTFNKPTGRSLGLMKDVFASLGIVPTAADSISILNDFYKEHKVLPLEEIPDSEASLFDFFFDNDKR